MEEGIHDFHGGFNPVKNHSDKKMIFETGGGWGNCINIEKWPRKDNESLCSVVGWKNPKPRVGDKLHVPMKSGKTLVCKFTSVRYCGNPADMFFADVKPLKYMERE